MMGSGITFTAIALLTVMARVYVLATMNRVASYDDVTILIAMVGRRHPEKLTT